MEKKIKFENVVAFIKKAMDLDFDINYSTTLLSDGFELMIFKELRDKTLRQYINWKYNDDKLLINLNGGFIPGKPIYYIIEIVDKKDVLKWEFLIEEVKEYCVNKLENNFKNFFNELQSPVKDINDLDNEDE